MTSTQQLDNLIDCIAVALSEYGYTERETGDLVGVPFVARIVTPRRWMVRYICAISHIPNDVSDVRACKRFLEDTRNCLTKHYARFPWWKELGTYSVLLCGGQLFEDLSEDLGTFKDKTGLHMNVLLGTCFIDIENFRSSADSTWGLFYSGRHFGSIREAVRQWCQRCSAETSLS